ncbi:SRPBCC family protein [Azospirillum halopraeferens]|uniref:SRPBCC family protein n=1 Tax=Azospirillum halopraeferens TaxID=34010 RepID=UPI000684DF00|nr:SRPBCC family protein [Azospirillum halopraeferens]
MTKETISFVYVTYIASTPERVFEAITRADIARHYWGHENISDWEPGSTWQHIRDTADRTVELVGKVVEISPPRRLVLTWAAASQADDPDAYSRVTFEIEEYGDMARLTVTHDELQAGSAMANGVTKGWPAVLSSLKSFLETGRGLNVFAGPKATESRQPAGHRVEGAPS